MRDNVSLKHAVFIAGTVIFVCLVVAWVLIPKFYGELKGSGEFGDMFGGVNALFSGLAFVGVVIAILLQKNELALQREELEQTREELAGQKEQLTVQSQTFQQQSFDNIFFHLLNLHNAIVQGIDTTTRGMVVAGRSSTITGRDCFLTFYNDELPIEYRCLDKIEDEQERWLEAYIQMYGIAQNDLGHYFRNLYHIIKFVDRSAVVDKKFYTNLVRAQLSSHELLMLFYNSVTILGREKFKPLIEKYALLKNMPKDQLHDPAHEKWYDPSAYGEKKSNH